MSIMEKIFGAKPTTPAPTSPQQQAQMQTPVTSFPANPGVQPTSGNGVVPENYNQENKSESGLENFKDLWKAPENKEEKQPLFNIDPVKLQEAAKQNDFTKAIPPELLKVINEGGEGATQAMLQVMNSMAQKGFADNTLTTSRIVEAALEKQKESFLKELPNIMKNHTVSENLRSTNPVFNDPAVAPVLDMMKSQVLLKHPNASAKEQEEMAMKYVEHFAAALAPKKVAPKISATEDWDSFLN